MLIISAQIYQLSRDLMLTDIGPKNLKCPVKSAASLSRDVA